VWRIVKEALWDSHERKRLYHEATEFLALRAERLKWVRKGGDLRSPLSPYPERLPLPATINHRKMASERRLRIKTLVMVLAMVVCANAGT